MNKIIIFGDKDLAELAYFYITKENLYEVECFTLNKNYITKDTFCGKPVVPFEDIENKYDPKQYKMFAPMTGANMSELRNKIYNEGKNKGYEFISYVSPKCTNYASKIGENCFIFEDNTIQPFVEIGNNVILWSGNHIGHHSIIRDNVFFTSHVVLSGHCDVGENSWIGVNSTIRDQIKIGKYTLIAMGSLITKNTDENGFYMGNPAKKQDKNSLEVY
jgi:sugar O-acyltransferase (sialic acid O-acetyltransferase NeuD family)